MQEKQRDPAGSPMVLSTAPNPPSASAPAPSSAQFLRGHGEPDRALQPRGQHTARGTSPRSGIAPGAAPRPPDLNPPPVVLELVCPSLPLLWEGWWGAEASLQRFHAVEHK